MLCRTMKRAVTPIQWRILKAMRGGCQTSGQVVAKTGIGEATVVNNLQLLGSGEDPLVKLAGYRQFGPDVQVSLTNECLSYIESR